MSILEQNIIKKEKINKFLVSEFETINDKKNKVKAI